MKIEIEPTEIDFIIDALVAYETDAKSQCKKLFIGDIEHQDYACQSKESRRLINQLLYGKPKS